MVSRGRISPVFAWSLLHNAVSESKRAQRVSEDRKHMAGGGQKRPRWRLRAPLLLALLVSAVTLLLGWAPATAVEVRSSGSGKKVAADEPRLPEASRVGPLRRGANGEIERFDPTVRSGNNDGPTRCSAGTICV